MIWTSPNFLQLVVMTTGGMLGVYRPHPPPAAGGGAGPPANIKYSASQCQGWEQGFFIKKEEITKKGKETALPFCNRHQTWTYWFESYSFCVSNF